MRRTPIYVVSAQHPLDQFDQAVESAMSGEGIKTMVVPGA